MNPDYAYTTAWRWAQKYEDAMEENKRLRAIFPKILAALESGDCSPDCSVEFLEEIPREVRLVVAKNKTTQQKTAYQSDQMDAALTLAARWGILSDGYSSDVSSRIRSWIIGGMKGEAPKAPDYYPANAERRQPEGETNL